MRVLIVKTSSMGDVLHTLPSLTDAMRAIPGIRFIFTFMTFWKVWENVAFRYKYGTFEMPSLDFRDTFCYIEKTPFGVFH